MARSYFIVASSRSSGTLAQIVKLSSVHLRCSGSFLRHAKTVSVNRRLGIVGSSDIDIRSFQIKEEESLLLLDQPTVPALDAIPWPTLANSVAIDLAPWRRR